MMGKFPNQIYFSVLLLFMFRCSTSVGVYSTVHQKSSLFTSHNEYTNLTIYLSFLDDLYNFLGENGDLNSDRCRNDTRYLLKLAHDGDIGALKILDSTGKPSSGILEGGVSFIGFYSECVNSVVDNFDGSELYGQYCLLNLDFSNSSYDEVISRTSWRVLNQTRPVAGVCLPSSCSESDVVNATTKSLEKNLKGVVVREMKGEAICHRNVSGFSKDTGAIFILFIYLLFISVALVGTIIDFMEDNKNILVISSNDPNKTKHASREHLCNDTEEKKSFSSKLSKFLLAFSFKRNAVKIFTVSDSGEGIRSLHGLKFLSMAFIIFGHTFSFSTQNLFYRNPGVSLAAPKDFVSQIFANGTLAVDTFYLISGILVAYVSLKMLKKTEGKFPFLYFYFHRYFRLTPLMMMVIFFSAYLLRYVGSGPHWLKAIEPYDVWCKENSWLNALYLHNFFHLDNMCLSHSWYLATDMQFYIVVPLMIIPLYKNIKYGAASLLTFLFVSIVTTAVITAVNHYPAIPYLSNITPQNVMDAYYQNVYIKPYCRIGPFIVGIAVGYYFLQTKDLLLSKITVALLWCCSTALALAVIYLMWPANKGILPSVSEAAAYGALARTIWAVSIAWLVIACNYGYGGLVNKFLSWTPFIPLSRLTYCAYLIHPVVMNAYYGHIETTVDFSISFMLYLFFGNICATYILSTFLSLLFESPFVALEKLILTK